MPGLTVPLIDADPKSSSTRTAPPGASFDLSRLRSLYSGFHLTCRKTICKTPVIVDDMQEHIESWLTGAQKIPPASQVSGLSCNSCYTSTCAGCGLEPTLGQENVFTTAGVVNSCCSRGRLYGIWLLLSHFDEREIASKKSHSQIKSSKSKKPKSNIPAHLAHFAETNVNGIGYAGGWDPYYHNSHTSTSTPFVDPEAEDPDDLTTLDLKLLTALIPNAQSLDCSNHLEDMLCLFRHSLLFDCLAELIRNDSIADLVERRDIYSTAFVFLETVADHSFLRQLLFEGRLNKKDSPGLRAICKGEGSLVFPSQLVSDERLPSIFTNGHNLFKQAQIFMKMIERVPPGSLDHSRESIRVCRTFMNVFQKLQREEVVETNLVSEVGYQDTWATFCEDNRVSFTDDVLQIHRYKDQFSNLKTSNKGRLSAIGKEIANMTTSLPTGVFLKVAESRSDVMKVLIVGIEDTPYAGGLFTFDLFLDANYPNSPPKMIFTLDGNDSEEWSFNPNLHKNTGTVCLSIINTWQGSASEMWQPGKTTILAVLISIQAMILGSPIPWINEPGFFMQEKTPEAHEHKLLIQYKTVRYAIIGWLGTPLDPRYAVWEDINKAYWSYNGLNTFLTVKGWAKDNSLIVKGSDTKANKKMKRKFNIPAVPTEDLMEKLATLLDLTTHLDPPPLPEVEEPTSSSSKSKGKPASASKGKGKRKIEVFSDSSDLDDSLSEDEYDHPLKPAAKPTKKKPAKKRSKTAATSKGKAKGKAKSKQIEDEQELITRWVYTGPKTQKETRSACADFGISGAKSIKDTITKLEMFVNDKNLGEGGFGQTWGALESI